MELTSEQVDVLSAEPSFRDALNRWFSEVGTAIPWSFWQRGFAMIRGRYEGRDVEASRVDGIPYVLPEFVVRVVRRCVRA